VQAGAQYPGTSSLAYSPNLVGETVREDSEATHSVALRAAGRFHSFIPCSE
jgi:hypothetical protein